MLCACLPEDVATALDEVALELLSVAGIDGPPVDALRVAQARRMIVAVDARQAGRARIVRSARQQRAGRTAAILLRPDPRPERRQWAIAHELGEAAVGHLAARLGSDPREWGPVDRESLANALAGRLLVPTTWLERDGPRCEWDLPTLKERYATCSHELLARRMLDLASPLVVVSVFDQGRLTWRRSNSGGPPPSLLPLERSTWQRVHQENRACVIRSTARLQVWPVHEPQWRREILRLELTSDGEACDAALLGELA